MKWLLVGLLLIPLVDALLLVVVADFLGWMATVLLVVLTALLGTLLVRAEGRHTLRKLSRKVQRGEVPTDELIDGGLLIAAGAFLLTPGLVTDAVGFLLAVPVTRYPFRVLVKRLVGDRLDERTGGFVSGRVYTGGFPHSGENEWSGGEQAGERRSREAGDTYDISEDGYSVEFEDEE